MVVEEEDPGEDIPDDEEAEQQDDIDEQQAEQSPKQEEEDETPASKPATTSLSRLQHNFRIPIPPKFPSALHTEASSSKSSKPLNALGSARQAVKLEEGEDLDHQVAESSGGVQRDIKPTWAALQKKQKEAEEQDVLELLSPRKKRRGWVA